MPVFKMFFSASFVVLFVLQASARSLGEFATLVRSGTVSNTNYDFIVVGGGTSGLTVADRLTEDPTVSVLVIEYGVLDNGPDAILVPGRWDLRPYIFPNTFSIPQKNLNNNTFFAPLCGVVGGGSTCNGMFYLRGSVENYDAWEGLGNPGWNYDSFLPYFKKSENFTRPDKAFAAQYNISWDDDAHGYEGPIKISHAPFYYPSGANFWSGALAVGLEPAKDPNGGENVGLSQLVRNVDPTNETRSFSRIGHYSQVINTRPNYHLLPGYSVSKILFDKNKKAKGVEYVPPAGGETLTAIVKKEIILAAGAVHSPQILQLSGVGPKSLLSSFNITTIVDLPGVGSNLQDHLVLHLDYNFTSNIFPSLASLTDNTTYNTEQQTLYDTSRLGAMTLTSGTGNNIIHIPLRNLTTSSFYSSILSLAKSQNLSSLLPANTHPSILAGYSAQRQSIYRHLSSLKTAVGTISWNTGPETTIYMISPLSRGSITISSNSILDSPLIHFNALSDPTDLELVLQLFLKNREITSTPFMQTLGPTELTIPSNITKDEDIKAKLRDTIIPTNAHECCTLPMMQRELGGVVDNELRVYGVTGVRVVDSSFWPIIIATAPTASVYAGAEKAADLIKKFWGIGDFRK